MITFVRELGLGRSNRPCSTVCGGPGSAEVVLLRQVLGLCLSLRIALFAHCPQGANQQRA
ncbi:MULTISPECIES: hypothetical protein [unclassified Nocardiopsis]|uniref:hypothetical protein n=1 Tax=unclassified Nocardiopsis TaxID=2649073 RepID=UPI000AD5AB72|nr:hypothetical protein [Nocardiopsis sp. TSRI0078]